MRNFLTPDRVFIFFASTLFGMLVNVLSNWVSNIGGWLLTTLFAAVAVSGIIAIIYKARTSHILVKMGPPVALRDAQKRQRNARQGMIAFVTLYNPVKDAAFQRLSKEEQRATLAERRQAALQLDYTCLNLEQSNLEPLIAALTAHRSRLRHIWLIATAGEKGSQAYLPVLIKYLREQKGFVEPQGEQGCHFHYGDVYQISLEARNDTEVVEDTRKLVETIFREAHAKDINIKDREIVADITGAPRSMPLGMILACLDGQRDIQFTGTQYDQAATPTGELVPMIFNFEPRFVKTE